MNHKLREFFYFMLRVFPWIIKLHNFSNTYCTTPVNQRGILLRKPWMVGNVLCCVVEIFPCLPVIGDCNVQA